MSFLKHIKAYAAYYDLCWLLKTPEGSFEISLGKVNTLCSIPARSTVLAIFFIKFRTSIWCAILSSLTASYLVSVRQYQARRLAYFSPTLTGSNLATCFALGRYAHAYGTFTLWEFILEKNYIYHSRHTQSLYAIPFGILRIANPSVNILKEHFARNHYSTNKTKNQYVWRKKINWK